VPEDTLAVTLEDVVAAGRVLFGPSFHPEGQGWRADLKTTYRRRALETHPDRARSVGRAECDLAREFRRVAEAYRVLSMLVAGPLPASSAAPEPPPAARGARSSAADRHGRRAEPAPPPRAAPAPGARRPEAPGDRVRYSVHQDALPRRRLRFAEYLYYSGRVPWTAFVEAMAWQRRQRPPVGRIAVDWGFLEPEDVGRILEARRRASAHEVPFGEFAVRLGYLTPFQLLAVLGRQLRLQRRIGQFFVERGYLEPGEIDELRQRIARHNLRWKE
jgi:hypothetical protein